MHTVENLGFGLRCILSTLILLHLKILIFIHIFEFSEDEYENKW